MSSVPNTINARLLAGMFLGAVASLESRKDWINSLNVFPVPDGDTGTNMTMTMQSAAGEVMSLGDDFSMDTVCKALSSGSLRGARGNSGVITSQLLRGFTKCVRESQAEEITTVGVAAAFERAVATAYKAVMKPKEGTILTVAKAGAKEAARLISEEPNKSMADFLEAVLAYMRKALEYTPELLPVLKQAGVVDSGGQGLVECMRGAIDVLLGKEVDYSAVAEPRQSTGAQLDESDVNIQFGYCTEFIILLDKPVSPGREQSFRNFLESMGDSIVFVPDDELIKVHVHTNEPGTVIQEALSIGPLSNMKIDNMRLEHRETLFNKETPESPAASAIEHKAVAFVAVAAGEGLSQIFRDLGVDVVIEGGQTMNPSTADILDAASSLDADVTYVLPNNKNVIMAANQAAIMAEKDLGRKLVVIPSRTVPQGIAALVSFMPDSAAEDATAVMTEALGDVRTSEITYAVRDTSIDGRDIHEGDYMAVGDAGIQANGPDLASVAADAVRSMADDSVELVTVYYGSDVDEPTATALGETLSAIGSFEVEVEYGGQPVYYYLISAE